MFLTFLVCKNQNRFFVTSDLLRNILLVVGQPSMNTSLALHTRNISTLQLTSNWWYIGQRITVITQL